MAHMFISESSRRPLQISEEEMQKKWDTGLGERKPIKGCSSCGELDKKYINGKCRKCASGVIEVPDYPITVTDAYAMVMQKCTTPLPEETLSEKIKTKLAMEFPPITKAEM